jgi:hypothetical protein
MTTKQSTSTVLKLLSAASVLLTGTALADGTVTAVYKVQELSFQYRLPRYSQPCQDLQARVANILLAVGARDDIKVDVRNCDAYMIGDDDMMDPMPGRSSDPFDRADPFERSNDPFNRSSSTFRNPATERRQSALIRIRLQMPVEMTPAVMKEVEKDKSRRELISRVTRNPGASMNDPILFEAQRQEVTLSSKTVRLKPEDCELLEQMSSQVFRKLDVKVTRRTTSCGRDSSRIPPQMDVEALLPTGRIAVVADPEKQKRKTVVEPTDDPATTPAEPAAAEPVPAPVEPPPQQQ